MSEKTPATSGPARGPVIRRMAHRAMATMFEILIAEADQAARGAAEAAFVEIDRLERLLSRFMPYSDVSRINAAEPGKAVVVEIETAECLQAARHMWERTDGAFDVTAGSPLRGSPPASLPLRGHGEKGAVGMKRIAIDADTMSVSRLDASVRIDLGGIGKGYALDRAADLLAEWGVGNVMLHGGTSTVRAIGHRPGRDGWQADLRNPSGRTGGRDAQGLLVQRIVHRPIAAYNRPADGQARRRRPRRLGTGRRRHHRRRADHRTVRDGC
jgi:thiamine biosynthesis lipoprotein